VIGVDRRLLPALTEHPSGGALCELSCHLIAAARRVWAGDRPFALPIPKRVFVSKTNRAIQAQQWGCGILETLPLAVWGIRIRFEKKLETNIFSPRKPENGMHAGVRGSEAPDC